MGKFYYTCRGCEWDSRQENVSIDDSPPDKCPSCCTELKRFRKYSKRLDKETFRIDDARLKGPALHPRQDNIKVRFDIRESSPVDDDQTSVAKIRFQIWDERLEDTGMVDGIEVPWCLMQRDNPAMIIKSREGEDPTLYFAKELVNKIYDGMTRTSYWYGYEARRGYVEAEEWLLKKLAQTEASCNRTYSQLRAEHIRQFALVVKKLKEECFVE